MKMATVPNLICVLRIALTVPIVWLLVAGTAGYVSQDLSDDHPVSVTFDNTLDTAFYDQTAIEAAGLPVVIHSGSAPDPGPYTSPAFLRRLLTRCPRLKVVVAQIDVLETM